MAYQNIVAVYYQGYVEDKGGVINGEYPLSILAIMGYNVMSFNLLWRSSIL